MAPLCIERLGMRFDTGWPSSARPKPHLARMPPPDSGNPDRMNTKIASVAASPDTRATSSTPPPDPERPAYPEDDPVFSGPDPIGPDPDRPVQPEPEPSPSVPPPPGFDPEAPDPDAIPEPPEPTPKPPEPAPGPTEPAPKPMEP